MDRVVQIVEVGTMKNEVLTVLESRFGLPPDDSRKLVSGSHAWIGPSDAADVLAGALGPLVAKLVVGRSHLQRETGPEVVALSALGEFVLDGLWGTHAYEVELLAGDAVRGFLDWKLAQWKSPSSVLSMVQREYEEDLGHLDSAKTNLLESLARHGASISDFENPGSAKAVPVSLWTQEADEVAATADSRRVPIFQMGRLEARLELLKLARPVMAAYQQTVNSVATRRDASVAQIHKRFFEEWLTSIRTGVEQGYARLDTAAMGSQPAPSTFVPRWAGGDGNPEDSTQPVVYLGKLYLAAHKIEAKLVSSDGKTTNTGSLEIGHEIGSFGYPIVLDLDATGGFVTDQRSVVESSVLQLLESIEPGMLKVEGVDPVGLGKSLDFLYGLNDAGDKVLGDAIWTTAEQVSKLLVEIEKHVTFVTQKYLQGQHSTLTEYNIAAGEVAEPYRVVLFYDFRACSPAMARTMTRRR